MTERGRAAQDIDCTGKLRKLGFECPRLLLNLVAEFLAFGRQQLTNTAQGIELDVEVAMEPVVASEAIDRRVVMIRTYLKIARRSRSAINVG